MPIMSRLPRLREFYWSAKKGERAKLGTNDLPESRAEFGGLTEGRPGTWALWIHGGP